MSPFLFFFPQRLNIGLLLLSLGLVLGNLHTDLTDQKAYDRRSLPLMSMAICSCSRILSFTYFAIKSSHCQLSLMVGYLGELRFTWWGSVIVGMVPGLTVIETRPFQAWLGGRKTCLQEIRASLASPLLSGSRLAFSGRPCEIKCSGGFGEELVWMGLYITQIVSSLLIASWKISNLFYLILAT